MADCVRRTPQRARHLHLSEPRRRGPCRKSDDRSRGATLRQLRLFRRRPQPRRVPRRGLPEVRRRGQVTDTFRERLNRELEDIRRAPRPWRVATVDHGDHIWLEHVVDANGRVVPPQIIMAELDAMLWLEAAARPLATFDYEPHAPNMP